MRLHWFFYRSAAAISIGISCLAALMTMMAAAEMVQLHGFSGTFGYVFALSNTTIGPACVFLYKEIARPGEYYFYYNRSIGKIALIVSFVAFGIPLSALVWLVATLVS